VTAVRIGRITTGRRARIHLALDGKTGCGARHRATVGYECNRPDLAAEKALCRRCFTRPRVESAEMALCTATGSVAARNRCLLADVAQAMRTPAQVAADEELAARIRATMAAAGSIMPLPPVERAESWRELRDAYAALTHHQPTAA
jgi:hypothetical protein